MHLFGSIAFRAIDFAYRMHKGHVRKATPGSPPYLLHPIAVGMTLAGLGCDEPTVAAGIVHDTPEENPSVTIPMIAEEVHPESAEIVSGVIYDHRLATRGERRAAYYGNLNTLKRCLVACADKHHNILCYLHEFRAGVNSFALLDTTPQEAFTHWRSTFTAGRRFADDPRMALLLAGAETLIAEVIALGPQIGL
jgi:hypothetical protein